MIDFLMSRKCHMEEMNDRKAIDGKVCMMCLIWTGNLKRIQIENQNR